MDYCFKQRVRPCNNVIYLLSVENFHVVPGIILHTSGLNRLIYAIIFHKTVQQFEEDYLCGEHCNVMKLSTAALLHWYS